MKRTVSMFRSCKHKAQPFYIPLIDWLKGLGVYRTTIDHIRSTRDKKTISKLKSTLPVAVISGVFSGRNLTDLKEHTGLICIDIDQKDNPEMESVEDMKSIISKLPFIMYCGLSASGKGLYCVIELQYPEKHIHQFYALEEDFLEIGIVIDSSCKDITRLRFFSYDNNAYYNQEATIYQKCIDNQTLITKNKNVMKKSKQQNNMNTENQNNKKEMTDAELLEVMNLNYLNDRLFFLAGRDERTWHQWNTYEQLDTAIEKKLDVTGPYQNWFIICNRIARYFGEEGRNLFHDASKFYPNYTEKECNELYDRCLVKNYFYSQSKFDDIFKQYGLR